MSILSKTIISILLIFIAFAALAQSKFINKIEAQYSSMKDLSLDFEQTTYVEAMDQQIKKQGTAQFLNPKKFIIEYTGTSGRMYVSDGQKLWYYLKGDKQVSVMKLSEKLVSPDALSLLGGFGNIFEQFSVSELSSLDLKELQITNSSLKWLKLIPHNKESAFQYYLMGVDVKTLLTNELIMIAKGGNKTSYRLHHILSNQGLTNEAFIFKKDGVKEVKRNKLE